MTTTPILDALFALGLQSSNLPMIVSHIGAGGRIDHAVLRAELESEEGRTKLQVLNGKFGDRRGQNFDFGGPSGPVQVVLSAHPMDPEDDLCDVLPRNIVRAAAWGAPIGAIPESVRTEAGLGLRAKNPLAPCWAAAYAARFLPGPVLLVVDLSPPSDWDGEARYDLHLKVARINILCRESGGKIVVRLHGIGPDKYAAAATRVGAGNRNGTSVGPC